MSYCFPRKIRGKTVAPARTRSAAEPDGRVRRGERNREKILEAVLELVREGDLQPTADRVAKRAAVGTRTVFRHFDDMESLLAEMSERVERQARPLTAGPSEGSLEERVRDVVARRTQVYERVAPFKRSANLMRWRSEFLQRNHQRAVRVLGADLAASLPELADAPDAIAQAVELLTSFEAWDQLRSDQRLGRERAQEAVEASVLALLAAP